MLATLTTEEPPVHLVTNDHAAAAECSRCGSWWHVFGAGDLRCPLGCDGLEEGDHARGDDT